MTLEINEQEREVLLEALAAAHSSLLDELLHTSSFEYRGMLHEKDDLLKNLKSRIEALAADNKTA